MSNIAAGIVLYNPEDKDRFEECINSVVSQFDKIYVYDNSTKKLKIEIPENVIYLTEHRNDGIAYALNRIMEAAKEDGCEWVVTMDQDSILPNHIVDEYNKYIHKKKIGIVCPQAIDKRRSYMVPKKNPNFEYVNFCITSGSCTSVNAWSEIGGFDDVLFIDLVDNEFCKRIRIAGYRIIQVNTVVLNQEFGDIIPKSKNIQKFWVGISKILHNQNFAKFSYKKKVNPLRVYYTNRNIIYVNNKLSGYGKVGYENYNCKSYLGFWIAFNFPSILRAEKKMDVFKAIVSGCKDGRKLKVEKWISKKRVLIINTSGLGVGGITTHMINYIDQIKNVYRFDVVSTITESSEVVKKLEDLGCKIYKLPHRKKHLTRYIYQLQRLMKHNNYDIVHVHGNSALMAIELFTALKSKIPKRIAHCHNTHSDYSLLNKVFNPLFDRVYTDAVACSQAAGEWLYSGDFTVLHNAMNIKKYTYNCNTRKKVRDEYGWNDKIILGHVGAFNEQKNQKFLLDLIHEINNNKKFAEKILLVLIGAGEMEKELKEYARKNDLKNVKFMGVCQNVEDLLQGMDVFLFPSLWEGLGISIIEAELSGLPCLASDNVPKEVNMNGMVKFFPLNEKEKWKTNILQMINNHHRLDIDFWKFKEYDINYEINKLKQLYDK